MSWLSSRTPPVLVAVITGPAKPAAAAAAAAPAAAVNHGIASSHVVCPTMILESRWMMSQTRNQRRCHLGLKSTINWAFLSLFFFLL